MADLNLDASVFEYSKVVYNKDFEDILKGIIACYYCIISDKIMLPNDENQIRDIMLCKYLKNRLFKEANPPLGDYHFDSETVENKGRADIRILCVNPYIGDYDYYIIECKRLNNINQNGETGLNGEYIFNGIARFLSGKYQFYKNTSGMIGFVITKMNITDNILNINRLLTNKFNGLSVLEPISKWSILPTFEYSYCSRHSVGDFEKIIYHLMFDFSDNISDSSVPKLRDINHS